MAKFDHFAFMRELSQGFDPSEEDMENFNPFMTLMTLSMDRRCLEHCAKMNTDAFYKLPKKIQCMAYTSFKGKDLKTGWKKSKVTTKGNKVKDIEMIMKVFDLSYSEAESCIQFGTVDMEEVSDLYAQLYDNSSIKFRQSRKRKKK